MKMIRPILLTGVLCAGSAVAQAADSPAQAGYCLQWMRNLLTQLDAPQVNDGVTPQWESDAFAAMNREQIAKLRPIFEQWRLYSLTLPVASEPRMGTEFLRGITQAKSDFAYLNAQTNAQLTDCGKISAADALTTCLQEKQNADPMTAGIRARGDPCMRGPQL